MSTGLVYLRPMPVMFVRRFGPYRDTTPAAWRDLMSWVEQRGLRAHVQRGYGLLRDNPRLVASARQRYDACIDVIDGLDETPEAGVGVQILPGGTFLRQRHKGSHAAMGRMLSQLTREHRVARGLELDPSRPFIQIYLDDPKRTDATMLRTDLCIPVVVSASRANRAAAAKPQEG